uniref:Kaptin-like n=1 Tax=Saccoglossus kowalevskii TaxID=10224 RepID=A0ABM0M084_SACKO|nr:PREDICTED: kaptin-like [Saccoglossus kowalevskii]
MSDDKVALNEVHFYGLSSQSNVYGLTYITYPDGNKKALVASVRGKIVSIEYQTEKGIALTPTAKEVHFTYIPGDAEIVSIDVYNRLPPGKGLVAGISFIKDAGNNPTKFLNIYSAWEPGTEYNLDNIAGKLYQDGVWERVFLLSGSDKQVHIFREDKCLSLKFSEVHEDNFFPEFQDLPSNVLWIDVKHIMNNRRLTAIGCENGYARIALVDTKNNSGTYGQVSISRINCDGYNEILLGTYGQQLLIYKSLKEEMNIETKDNKDEVQDCLSLISSDSKEGKYKLVFERMFLDPVLAMQYIDITHDGLKELMVVSLKGVHVFQHNLQKAAEKCKKKLEELHSSRQKDTG